MTSRWQWLVVFAALALALFSQFQRRNFVQIDGKIVALEVVPAQRMHGKPGCIVTYRYRLGFEYPAGTRREVAESYGVESVTCDIEGANEKRLGDTEAVYVDPTVPDVNQGSDTLGGFAVLFAMIGALIMASRAVLARWFKHRLEQRLRAFAEPPKH
jgi:hypothetical protein